MPFPVLFERTKLEEGVSRMSRQIGDRLFSRPRQLVVVQALGAEALIGVSYPRDRFVNRAYVLARRSDGLQVVTHQAVGGSGGHDCRQNECVSVTFMDGVTEIDQFAGGDMPLVERLRHQNSAHDAVEEIRRSGEAPEHNPFLGDAARRELQQLALGHVQDPLLVPLAGAAAG